MSTQQELSNIPAKYTAWISLGKNIFWVLGLVVIAALRFQNLDNRISRLEEENARLNNIYERQTEQMINRLSSIESQQNKQLMALTQLQTLLQERTSASRTVIK